MTHDIDNSTTVKPFYKQYTIDALAAVLLMASPWLFQFASYVCIPHVLAGSLELVTVAISMKSVTPSTDAHGLIHSQMA